MIRDLTIAQISDAAIMASRHGPAAEYNLPFLKWIDVLWEHAKEGRALVEMDRTGVNGVAVYALVNDPEKADREFYSINGSGTVVWCPFATSEKPGILRRMVSYVKKKHPTVRELAYRRAKTQKVVRRRLNHGR